MTAFLFCGKDVSSAVAFLLIGETSIPFNVGMSPPGVKNLYRQFFVTGMKSFCIAAQWNCRSSMT